MPLAIVVSVVSIITACQTTTQQLVKPNLQQVKQTLIVIVMFEPSVDKTQLQQIIEHYHGNVTYQYTSLNGMAV